MPRLRKVSIRINPQGKRLIVAPTYTTARGKSHSALSTYQVNLEGEIPGSSSRSNVQRSLCKGLKGLQMWSRPSNQKSLRFYGVESVFNTRSLYAISFIGICEHIRLATWYAHSQCKDVACALHYAALQRKAQLCSSQLYRR